MRAFHLIATKKIGDAIVEDAIKLTVIQFAVVALCALGVSLLSGHFSVDLVATTTRTWAILFYMAFVCTFLAFFIQLKVVRFRSASHVGLLLGTEPVFATLIAVTLGTDVLSTQGWIGVALIVAATYWGRYLIAVKEE